MANHFGTILVVISIQQETQQSKQGEDGINQVPAVLVKGGMLRLDGRLEEAAQCTTVPPPAVPRAPQRRKP